MTSDPKTLTEMIRDHYPALIKENVGVLQVVPETYVSLGDYSDMKQVALLLAEALEFYASPGIYTVESVNLTYERNMNYIDQEAWRDLGRKADAALTEAKKLLEEV